MKKMQKMKNYLLTMLISTSSLVALPEAIIFDFGGVMTGESQKEVVVDYLKHRFFLSEEEFLKASQERKKSGKTDVLFWKEFAEKKQIKLPQDFEQELLSVMKQAINPTDSMYLLVDSLKKQGFKVGMHSLS